MADIDLHAILNSHLYHQLSAESQGALSKECLCLPGVRSALIFVDPQRRRSLLEAVNALASRVSARSAVTAACVQFRAFFLARPDIFYADPVSGLPLITEEEAAGWLRVRLQLQSFQLPICLCSSAQQILFKDLE